MAQWRSGAVAQWRSGAVAQWRSGAVAQWRSGAVAQWRSGAVAQWRSGAVAQWRSGAVAQWRSGAVARASDSRLSGIGFSPCAAVCRSPVLQACTVDAQLTPFYHFVEHYQLIGVSEILNRARTIIARTVVKKSDKTRTFDMPNTPISAHRRVFCRYGYIGKRIEYTIRIFKIRPTLFRNII